MHFFKNNLNNKCKYLHLFYYCVMNGKTFFPNDDRGWVGWEIKLRHNDCKQVTKEENITSDNSELNNEGTQNNHEEI